MADIPDDVGKKIDEAAKRAEVLAKKLNLSNKEMKEMLKAGSGLPDLFEAMTERGRKLMQTFNLKELAGGFKNLNKLLNLSNIGLIAVGATLKAIEVTLKAIVNIVGSIVSLIGDVLLGAVKKLGSAVGFLYDQFKKLGEKIFNFNLDFNKFLDQQAAGFFKLTQAGREYVTVLDGSIDVLRQQGLSILNVNQNMGSLFDNTVLFRDATNSTRRELVSFVSVLDQAGISADASTRMIQILNMTYLDTGKQTKAATERILQFARAAGISGRVAAADFANAATVIAAHGEGMEEVFKGLLTQTRATGLGMNDILGVAGQFSTFEKSAQAVGKLNALMGGPYLNSIKMVYMSEDERVRAVLAAMEASGKSWKSMDRFTRQAYASAAGITDMTKANELFSKGLIGFDIAAAKAKKAAKEQSSLEKAAKQATDIMTNFLNVLKGFAISFRPLIDGAARFIDRLAIMNFESKQAIGKVGVLAGGVAMLAKTFGPLGLAGSLLLLYDKWETIRDDFLGPGGMKILDSYLEKLKSIVKKIPGFIKLVSTEIARIWNELMQDEEFKTGFNNLKTFIIDSFKDIASIIGKILKYSLTRALIPVFENLQDTRLGSILGVGQISEKLTTSLATSPEAENTLKRVRIARANVTEQSERARVMYAKYKNLTPQNTSPAHFNAVLEKLIKERDIFAGMLEMQQRLETDWKQQTSALNTIADIVRKNDIRPTETKVSSKLQPQ